MKKISLFALMFVITMLSNINNGFCEKQQIKEVKQIINYGAKTIIEAKKCGILNNKDIAPQAQMIEAKIRKNFNPRKIRYVEIKKLMIDKLHYENQNISIDDLQCKEVLSKYQDFLHHLDQLKKQDLETHFIFFLKQSIFSKIFIIMIVIIILYFRYHHLQRLAEIRNEIDRVKYGEIDIAESKILEQCPRCGEPVNPLLNVCYKCKHKL